MNKFTTSLASLALATTAACSGAQVVHDSNKCEAKASKLTSRLIDVENAVRTAKIEKRKNGYISNATAEMIRKMLPSLYDEQILMEGECVNQKPMAGIPNIRSFEFQAETVRKEIRTLGIIPLLPSDDE